MRKKRKEMYLFMDKKKLALTVAIAMTLTVSSVSGSLPAVVYAQENVIGNEGNVAESISNESAKFNISEGSISIENHTVTMNGESTNVEGSIILTGKSAENTIAVKGDVDLVFNNLNVSTTLKDRPVVDISAGNVKLELQGNNALENVGGEYACLRVSNAANLTVDGQGSLSVRNGDDTKANPAYGSGIGGNYQESPGSITMNDGNISVVEYGTAAAIGGGAWADSGKISIAGGNIDVQVYDGGDQATGTGIGGGSEGYKGANHIGKGGSVDVSITGGKVTVLVKPDSNLFGPAESGAAIGSGQNKGGTIYIGGNAAVNAKTWGESAAIGGGAGTFGSSGGIVDPSQDDPLNISIEGKAQVNAETMAVDVGEPYPSGAAIGSGSFNHQKCNIIIKGSSQVHAKNGAYGAGIGGAFEHRYPEPVSVTITENAIVDASSDWFGAGIGTGRAQSLPQVSSSVSISGNANVKATGGKGGYDLNGGAGIGAGSESWIASIVISDQANVVAVGGTDAAAIGGAISTPQFGNIKVGKDADLEAYADGTLFAVDTRCNVEGITNSMLNARFVEDANEADKEKPFYIELDGNKDRKLTLPANYRSFASTTSIVDNESHVVYVKSNDTVYAYYPEDNSKLIQYDIKNQQMLVKDNLDWLTNTAPKIQATDKVLNVGDTFDPLKDVIATDKEDGILTDKIEVLKNTVDTNKAGVYEVTYKVTDSKGASSTKTIKVTVIEKETPIVPDEPNTDKPSIDKSSTDKLSTEKPNDDKGSPKTGDQTNVGFFTSIFTMSAIGIAVLMVLKKKRLLENK